MLMVFVKSSIEGLNGKQMRVCLIEGRSLVTTSSIIRALGV